MRFSGLVPQSEGVLIRNHDGARKEPNDLVACLCAG